MKKMFQSFKKGVAKVGKALAVTAGLGVAAVAHADLPTAATTAFTTIQTDGLALIDLAWPVAIAITGGFIILRLFKRGAKAAT